MFDIYRVARQCIVNRKVYCPNKPPDEKMRELGLEGYVDLATNENPSVISPKVYQAIVNDALPGLNHYPESTCCALANKLANKFNLKVNHFFIDNGLDAVITMLGLTFIDPLDEVVIAPPTFPAYKNIAQKMGGTVVEVPRDSHFQVNVEALLSAVTNCTKLVFLCNPNNPTGMVTPKKDFYRILAHVPQDVLVVSDEAFYEFVDDPEYPETIPCLQDYPNLIVLRSFSKTMALAGLRVGYAIASSEIVNMMMKAREPFPVNCIAQVAASAVLEDEEFINHSLRQNRLLRDKLCVALDDLGVKYMPSQSNFVMLDLGFPARPIWQSMFDQGVVVRLLEEMDIPNGLRICIGREKDLQRAINALASALGKKSPNWVGESVNWV